MRDNGSYEGPLISIVIPVYNASRHVARAIDSCLGQRWARIEVICVDDGSEDGSLAEIRAKAGEDTRVKVLALPRNQGAHVARRTGVQAAQGEYITFLDSDDELAAGACGLIAREMGAEPSDILHFGVRVVNEGGIPASQVQVVADWFTPTIPRLEAEEIVLAAYERGEYCFNVCGKAFRADIAKRAFDALGERRVALGEDGYEYFALAFFSGSYRAVIGSDCYIYHYGRGVTGRRNQTAQQFARSLRLHEAVEGIGSFLEGQGAFDDYSLAFRAYRDRQLAYLLEHWRDDVREADKPDCLADIIVEWGPGDVALQMACLGSPSMDMLVQLLGPGYRLDGEVMYRWGRADAEREMRHEYESSASYRIGRALTALPRRVRGR